MSNQPLVTVSSAGMSCAAAVSSHDCGTRASHQPLPLTTMPKPKIAAPVSKEVYIDGISATAQIQGHIGESSPTMEAVQEFKVQTSGMSAEYGRTSGGVFNFALKSGTNRFSGSAFYYGRNEALNANTWMNNWNKSQH